MPKNPKTREEWQAAVNAAEFYLLVHSAECYGLITGPEVDVARCEEILAAGKRMGIVPQTDHRAELAGELRGKGRGSRRGAEARRRSWRIKEESDC